MKANLQYLRYVVVHKWYVLQGCFKYGLYWQGIIHDWSKFLPNEWIPYKNFFNIDKHKYGRDFTKAWNLHLKRNPHHWQYWVTIHDNGKLSTLEMPERYVKEMIADWRGAAMAIHGKDDLKEWYLQRVSGLRLHPNTRKFVEKELGL